MRRSTPTIAEGAVRQQEHSAVQQQLAQERHALQMQWRQAQERQTEALIANFAADKSYWSALEPEIVHHIWGLKATNPDMPPHEVLQRAHDRALAQRPDLDSRAAAERKSKADEAKRLASLNVGRRAANSRLMPVGQSMEQTMREIADRLMPG